MNPIIAVENLTKSFKLRTNKNLFTGIFKPEYRLVPAVSNISFNVAEGESVAFLGPNGAGKTTTTKMLTGLLYPTSGKISVLGYTPFERKKEYLKQIGLVMGNKAGLSWDLTAEQSFEFLQKIYDIDLVTYKKTVAALVDLLDVSRHMQKQIRKLSLGERMKFELIGAILHKPNVLFLDEPTIGLDITSKKNIRNFLREIQQNSNITLLLTSHDMDDVATVCDRVLVINKGTKVYDAPLKTLTAEYNKKKYIKFFLDAMPTDLLNFEFTYARVEQITSAYVLFEVTSELVPKLISEMLSSYTVLDIDISSVPLEEIIEDIFKQTNEISTIV